MKEGGREGKKEGRMRERERKKQILREGRRERGHFPPVAMSNSICKLVNAMCVHVAGVLFLDMTSSTLASWMYCNSLPNVCHM